MSETIGERIPGAVERVGRWLGSDLAQRKLNRELLADLMALHAAAKMWQDLQTAEQFFKEGSDERT